MKIEIPEFEKARVLVIGDVMLDRYWYGDTFRISPEAPVPVVHIRQTEERVGGAGNVALNVHSLGAATSLIGLVGNDNAATILETRLQDVGVKAHLLRAANPTITKLRVIGRSQQLIRLDTEEPFAEKNFTELFATYEKKLAESDIVILSDYGKGTLRLCEKFIARARKSNIPVLVDPKSRDFSIYSGATVITPNLTEFEAVVGHCKDDAEIERKGLELIRKYSFQAILITRGAQGMSLICNDAKAVHLPTRAQEVYDVTGAGDTVIATLAAALAAGEEMVDAIIFANAAAGVSVRKLGAAAVSVAELRRAMQKQQDPWAGILSEEHLLQEISDARAHGEKIVMTNGCFDVLHSGHITYLEKAKGLGQRLLIAVNTDDSVRRLKGKDRPVNKLEQRMLVLAALRAVDWVVAFSEDTPERIIHKVAPDILVKGGDYKLNEIVGADFVQSYGGKVVIVPFEDGFSTTSMLERIRGEK
ncbi:MAG: bifunctional D-glycero-beta-D-manno-heptose-7-phosphate kinase/D-glycero-beta-D-manno-heptose 1-phosphate adenylyltransferase HldE [Gammaproteobacteria bacterium]|nr:bifunctional D-glycero-beta-D-manno-heptose-7-phosphate kinase/D-glycero-beta-D-manno-heptose 1-phosphate adenylyltransferase HldE [Gammaproteobacteria bacterium]